MSNEWRPGLPEESCVCDVRIGDRVIWNVRVRAPEDPGKPIDTRFPDEDAAWLKAQRIDTLPQPEWRPIPTPDHA